MKWLIPMITVATMAMTKIVSGEEIANLYWTVNKNDIMEEIT